MASTTASQPILTRQSTPNQNVGLRTSARSTPVSVFTDLLATRASGPHPFPFRTRSLSPTAPMVLRSRDRGRVGRRRRLCEARLHANADGPRFFCAILPAMTRAGFVTLVGRPNAGKSTLLNRLIGQKLSIVSPKPQSTRDRVVGILTQNDTQLVLLDTPGLLDPQYELQRTMRAVARGAMAEADAI